MTDSPRMDGAYARWSKRRRLNKRVGRSYARSHILNAQADHLLNQKALYKATRGKEGRNVWFVGHQTRKLRERAGRERAAYIRHSQELAALERQYSQDEQTRKALKEQRKQLKRQANEAKRLEKQRQKQAARAEKAAVKQAAKAQVRKLAVAKPAKGVRTGTKKVAAPKGPTLTRSQAASKAAMARWHGGGGKGKARGGRRGR
jgi:septal ring factor EnvC (AmiA/AmiB activator)